MSAQCLLPRLQGFLGHPRTAAGEAEIEEQVGQLSWLGDVPEQHGPFEVAQRLLEAGRGQRPAAGEDQVAEQLCTVDRRPR